MGAFELADSYLEYVMCSNLTAQEIHDAHAQLKVDSIVSLLAYCFHELGDIPKARKFIGYSLLYCGDINEKIPHTSVDKYASLILEELAIVGNDQVDIILNDAKGFVDNATHIFKARHIVEHQITGLWRAFRAAFERLSAKIMIDMRTKNCDEPEVLKEAPPELRVQLCSALENLMDDVAMEYKKKPEDDDSYDAILMDVSRALTKRKASYCVYYAKRDPKGAIEGLMQAHQALSDSTEKLQRFTAIGDDLGGVYGWRGVITMEITLITSYTGAAEEMNDLGYNSINEETAIADIEQCLMLWRESDDCWKKQQEVYSRQFNWLW
ncbi:hypothetical protein BBO99_00002493 [Phytophthora kernoviae]|uniref:Uncharacterized protein n=2 Tax=Phytophthora kernoviae TaxID=325452 RepID=A0A421F860_9STRA|nr:hypothetical protein G195_004623 [Phytophthora kernoviae 00238/432]KAG2526746.1 hypothetical protein JM16_003709 [Phytophthora kernoviae]KAG2530697.1 hypothetical protein JM18_001965 [Phytophthora kernoviae]RLN27257.1 hypothetical protein BBI17_002415 [Phytophthora kernoviae]RLN82994.1 hypothetical protein BBO99_00002493 [Phytophthora kernoviae]